jgi:putative PIN family toxin of toxin-antitoxin system
VRVFLDTNVLASGLAARGLCAELIEGVFNEHELLTCEPVLQELERVLAQKFRLPDQVIKGFLGLLKSEGEVVRANKFPALSFKDPDDIPILACAIAGRTDVFVTGDKALLELREIEGIPILSVRQFWQRLAGLDEPDTAR